MPAAESPPTLVLALVAAFLSGSLGAWIWAIDQLRRGHPLLPEENPPRPVPWGLGSVIAVALLWVTLLSIIPAVLHPFIAGRAAGAHPVTEELSPFQQLLLLAAVNASMIVLVPGLLAITSGARLADLGLGRGPIGRVIVRGVVACLLICPAVYAINLVAVLVWDVRRHPLEVMIRDNPSTGIALLAFVSGVVLAPAAEEMVFRAVLQGWLMRHWRQPGADPELIEIPGESSGEASGRLFDVLPRLPAMGVGASRQSWIAGAMPNLVISAIFAGIHASQWPAPLAIFPLSLGLGYLYQRTGSLVASFTLHATFNGFSTMILFASLA